MQRGMGAAGSGGRVAGTPSRPAPAGRRRWAMGVARLAWGTTLLAAPGRVARAMGAEDSPAVRRLGRVLGARHVLQAAVELAAWPRWHRMGAAVDGAHALSAAVAALDRRWRRPALADAVVACAFAVAGLPQAAEIGRSARPRAQWRMPTMVVPDPLLPDRSPRSWGSPKGTTAPSASASQ